MGHLSDQSSRDYETMSRDELMEMIGGDVDPMTTREQLIMMAKEADATESM